MKKLLKKLGKRPELHQFLSWVLLAYMRFVFKTMRWELQVPIETQALFDDKRPILFSFWHGRLFMASAVWKKFIDHTPVAILVSQHGDGDYASRFLKHYDIDLLRGSTSKGAVAGAKAVLGRLKKGYSVSLTVDGPRGPRMRIRSGISRISSLSRTPVVAFCYSAKWGINAGSWDAMLIPLPFTKAVMNFSTPFVPERGSEAEMDEKLEAFMISQQTECDAQMKRSRVNPS